LRPCSVPLGPRLEASPEDAAWRAVATGELRLARGEILVLSVRLDLPAAEVLALRSSLAPEEAARADRFHRAIDRERFLARRGRLREVLARLLGAKPGEVAVGTGARGKPAVAVPGVDLSFNSSHSGGWALFALAWGEELGVDLELGRRAPDARPLAERFFAPEEAAYLAACAPERLESAFFSLWTRKEAVVKCVGEGLHLGLDAFALTPATAASSERVALEAAPNGALWVHALPPPVAESFAAMACETQGIPVRCRSLC
jgi:4'-phosphopantetheinyl transferase